jgi:hypothetical protein
MQDIQTWLSGNQDFETGAKLYIKYGHNSFFKNLLEAGPTPYNETKLVSELQNLAPVTPAINQEPKALEPVQEPKPIIKPVVNEAEHLKYIQLKDHVQTLYRQLDRNQAMLDLSEKQQILFDTARQIISLRKKIVDTWAIINFYEENGYFYKEPIKKEFTVKEQIQHLRASISKAKQRLSKPNCLDREKTEQLIIDNKNKILVLGGKVK